MKLMKHILTVIKSTRPSFLVLSPVCIFLGYSSAILSGAEPEQHLVILVFVGAVCAHISVNTFNEYLDFKSGLDHITQKTPFSGGSGALPEDPGMASSVLALAILTIIITLTLGIYFIYLRGLSLLLLLTVGIFIILAYTRWLNKQPLLCLLAPGLSFGPLYVVGSHVVLAGNYDLTNFYLSLVPFLLISNLLLLNQYPDIDADKSIGRKHFPISYGVKKSNLLYICMAGLVVVIVIFGVSISLLPVISLMSLIPMLIVIPIIFGITKYAENIEKLIPYLAMNVFIALGTPLALGISILIS
jgi:1,4-dihydroxy-2-naphthoate polyprenyltransferase